jgi:glycosyltransferase involved in cell wall biosynthesis
MLALLCEQLGAEFQMEVICDGHGDVPDRLQRLGIPVLSLPLTTKWSFARSIPRLAAILRRRSPDVVHLHGQFAGSLGQVALALAGRRQSLYAVQWPSYLSDGGVLSRWRNRVAERVSCGGASVVVAVSEHDHDELLARDLCNPDKLTTIHNAYYVDESVLRTAAPSSDYPIVGFLGRLADQKGCEYLLEAVPMVLAKHPRARILIIGDGPERRRLELLTSRLGIASAVEFVGYDPNPTRRMQSMTVLAIPSLYEPLGMVALEAMACGTPVVGSRVGGIPEVVVDGRTGLLVPPRDPEALARALLQVLGSKDIAAEMGRLGQERARQDFNPTMIAGKYAELYRRLAAATSS